ncbi:sugar kinase [Streptomyces indicus]|uniref:2-dehydro-3-deoxygluconokinase n=1 Tax=Streptomyces indicus TaxID=417292 RepID=A0A1G9INB0_9ACTN|nr:sugar kinase [Streptomyces indicus]SDL26413.1 2-dehydro-3-deoxygluconokinase [Streptomyces indicus]
MSTPLEPQASAPDVLTFGETMLALRGSGPLKLGGAMQVSVAGAESNVAIGLGRLGHRVRWAGAVGEDEAGELVLRTLRAEGVDVSGASRDAEAPTGLILFEPRLPEVTRVHYYRSGSAGSRLKACAVEAAFTAAPPKALHLTGITPALGSAPRCAARRALSLAREHSTLVCLDVNFRSRLWSSEEAASVLREWMPYVDVLIASDDELPLCLPADAPRDLGEQAKLLLDLGIGEVVVKYGADGAAVHTAEGELRSPARTVQAVDPVGAGDAFVAGYLSALLDGEDAAARLDRAVTTGAFAVASRGDWEGAPTRAELPLLGAASGTVVR